MAELAVDRKLLKPNFQGYKLSLEPIPIIKHELTVRPYNKKPSDAQFSFLHAQLFGLHNHLIRDAYQPNCAYFIDAEWTVQKIQYDDQIGKLRPLAAVFKIPHVNRDAAESDYNASLCFISDRYALLGDGAGHLFVLDTGNRRNCDEWKAKFQGMVYSDADQMAFVVQDGRFEVTGDERRINCLLIHIEQRESHFETVVDWFVLKQAAATEGKWEIEGDFKRLVGAGSLYYCALEKRSKALVVASDRPLDFLSNVLRRREEAKEAARKRAEEVQQKEEVEAMEKEDTFPFTWSQTDEDITVNFNRIEGAGKADYVVKCHGDEIGVKCKDQTMLEGKMFDEVDADLTTWSVQNDFLQVLLIKRTPGRTWPFWVVGGPEQEESKGKSEDETTTTPSLNLTSQLEECDFGGQENHIARLAFDSETITHQIYLGTHTPLFAVSLRSDIPPAIALRHDVDALVWMQYGGGAGPDEWRLRHEGTLHALGYVQASKQQKKYTLCSPDLNYAVICEPERHVFIYKGSYEGSATLRNRNGPQVSVGQQKLVSLETGTGEVLGMSVENDVTLLLTESFIICLQLRIEE